MAGAHRRGRQHRRLRADPAATCSATACSTRPAARATSSTSPTGRCAGWSTRPRTLIDERRRRRRRARRGFAYVDPGPLLRHRRQPVRRRGRQGHADDGQEARRRRARRAQQVLPLDNLDENISPPTRCSPMAEGRRDHRQPALPRPPQDGRRAGRRVLAAPGERLPGRRGVSDFVTYWFPRTHDHLPTGGRAGSRRDASIRERRRRAKASLDYVVDHGGVIFDAVSSQPWSGDAVVHVSIVNWIKGD